MLKTRFKLNIGFIAIEATGKLALNYAELG